MADVTHSSLTDPYLHEPKGAAAASDGQVFIADGAGSGAFAFTPTGWGHYKDDAAAQTFNTTAAKLSIDGAGSSSESGYLPLDIRGSAELWDTTNDKITPVAVGDQYDLRIDLPVTGKTGSPTLLTLELDISGAASPTTVIVSRDISTSKTPPYTISVGFPIFTLSSFVTNGGQLFFKTDTGTVDITAPAILVARNHGEVV